MGPLLLIPLRNVWRNRRRSLLACAAVFFGVFALLCVRGALNGLQVAIRAMLVDRHLGALQVHKTGYMKQVVGTPLSLGFPVDEALLARVRAVPHVKGASARLAFGGMLSVGDLTAATLAMGMDPVGEYSVCPKKREDITQGAPIDASAPNGVVPSAGLVKRLGWEASSQAALLAPDVDGVLNAVDIRLQGALGAPNVVGLETRILYLPLAAAQELLRMEGRATELAVAIDDLENLQETRRALEAVLGPGFEVHTWEDLAPAIMQDERNQELVFGILVAMFLLAALVGITNTMLVNMLERTREIGTMLAVGTRRRKIVTLFVVEGVLLALLGCTLGVAAASAVLAWGHAVGVHIRGVGGGILSIYPTLAWWPALKLAVECGLGAVVASMYPAYKASRMSPVQALAGVS